MAIDLLSPDVQAEEVSGNNATIPQASTTTFALAGYSPRGPENTPTYCGSLQQFVQIFGTFSPLSFNAYCASAYFLNGGNQLVFVRVLHEDATYATGSFPSAWNVQASGRGVWANGAQITISGNPAFFSSVSGGYSAFDAQISLIDPTTELLVVSETYSNLDLVDDEDPQYIESIINNESQDVIFTAAPGGIPSLLQPHTQTAIQFSTGVTSQNSYTGTLTETPILPGSMAILVGGVQKGTDDGNGNLITSGSSSVSGSINYATGAIALYISPAPTNGQVIAASFIQSAQPSMTITLEGGTDGSEVVANDLISVALEPLNQGIYAFNTIIDQFQLALPDFAGQSTVDLALITYAESRDDVVVLIQPPQGVTPQAAVNYRRNTILGNQSSYAAMYYPWIKVPDPLNNSYPLTIPPCGHAAGRYAYTDLNANVGKAPAGVNRGQLQFTLGLERSLAKGDRDLLYPAQVNPIRSDSEVGICLWGNKTLQVLGDYTDVNIRRLFIYLRKTQNAGLLDIVFEDVGDATYGVIQARLDIFLEGLFKAGYFGSGVSDKSQAFKVICDQSNNPQSVQLAKQIIIDEYIKPNIAAEIIILRLQRVFDASQP
jgi:Phage tail sheath protein subtilisin-like domain